MDQLSPFERHQYINVETYRRNGQGVRTPVWFVAHAGELCFTTEASSGKVKRLRHTTQVKVAPCTARGEVLGEWRAAGARFLTTEETAAVKKTYARKYGLMKSLFDLAGLFKKSERVYIALALDPQ